MYGGLMSGKKRKYFTNNWRKIKDLPDELIPQLEYEDVLEKNWSLVPNKNIIIRCENKDTGKVKEFSFQREKACVNRIESMQDTHDITICTDDIIGVVANIGDEQDESDFD